MGLADGTAWENDFGQGRDMKSYRLTVFFMYKAQKDFATMAYSNIDAINNIVGVLGEDEREDVITIKITYAE